MSNQARMETVVSDNSRDRVCQASQAARQEVSREIASFARPYDVSAIDDAVRTDGAVILRGVVSPRLRKQFNSEVGRWLELHPEHKVGPQTDSIYGGFQGYQTLRIHSLVSKFPSVCDLMTHPDLLGWAERALAPICSSVLLSVAELIEIRPGQAAQFPHRDSDLWVHLPRGEHSVAVNAIVAMSPFIAENGATRAALGSHWLPSGADPAPETVVAAVMDAGDAFLFRADLIHGGGANSTADERRRGLSLSYQVGWLRTVEAGTLNVPPAAAAALPPKVQDLLGYAWHDAADAGGGVLGLFEEGDPHAVLAGQSAGDDDDDL